MSYLPSRVELLDVTLRDGEQTRGVSFSQAEKVSIAKALLGSLKVDRIEVASAGISEGEQDALMKICDWASEADLLERVFDSGRIEVGGFATEGAGSVWKQPFQHAPHDRPSMILFWRIGGAQ